MVNILSDLIPTCLTEGQYLHPGPKHIEIASRERSEEPSWSLNTDAHLRSVLSVMPLVRFAKYFG